MGDLNQRQIANAAAFRLGLGERKEFVRSPIGFTMSITAFFILVSSIVVLADSLTCRFVIPRLRGRARKSRLHWHSGNDAKTRLCPAAFHTTNSRSHASRSARRATSW